MPDIREPWAVYELDGDGVDAKGNGPALDVTGAGTGKLGSGAVLVENPSPPDFAFLLSTTEDSAFGFWYDVQAGDLTFGGDGLVALTVRNGSTRLVFSLGSDGVDMTLTLTGTSAKSETAVGLSVGWNHFAFSRSGNSTQFYVNGVAVGAASNVVPSATGVTEETLSLSEGGGLFDQPVFAQVAYTVAEWAYIYNSGNGRLYTDWNPAAAGGNGRINLLTMGVG